MLKSTDVKNVGCTRLNPGSGRSGRWWGVLALLFCMGALSACVPRLGDSDAALALEDLAAPRFGSRLKSLTPPPERRTITYAIDRVPRRADLYLSPKGARAGIVVVPGVTPQGKDDSRLVALADTLARLQFAVLVPDLQGVRRYQVNPGDVDEIADAFRYLQSQPELAPGGSAGIMGISYSAGPAVLAALEPGVREELDFVATLGGYFDIRSTITFITTGYYRSGTDGHWERLNPDPYARFVFLTSYAGLVERPADRGVLRAHARSLLDDTDIVPTVTPSGLAPDARALYELVMNRDPERVQRLIDRLSPRIRRQLEALNPAARDLSGFQGRFIMVHGRSDNVIPYSESVALDRALPVGSSELYVIEGFAHVDHSLKPQDIEPMLRAVASVLAQRVDDGSKPVSAGRGALPAGGKPPPHPASPGAIY